MAPRKPIFDAILAAAPPRVLDDAGNVLAVNNILDALGVPQDGKAHALRDPASFFARVRDITGRLDAVQVSTINDLLSAAAHWPIGWLAYGLATAWHEARLTPIEEIGKGRGKAYGSPGKYHDAQYGRGLVQLTWDRNYEWADKELAEASVIRAGELLADFGRALEPAIATFILVRGMETGAFTGKKLADYINKRGVHATFIGARRIINGSDRAELIAGYADRFQDALDAGGWK